MAKQPKWRTAKVTKLTLSEKSLHADVDRDEQLKLAFEILKNWMNDKDTGISVLHTKKDRFLIHAIDRK